MRTGRLIYISLYYLLMWFLFNNIKILCCLIKLIVFFVKRCWDGGRAPFVHQNKKPTQVYSVIVLVNIFNRPQKEVSQFDWGEPLKIVVATSTFVNFFRLSTMYLLVDVIKKLQQKTNFVTKVTHLNTAMLGCNRARGHWNVNFQ